MKKLIVRHKKIIGKNFELKFSKRLEMEESYFWINLLRENNDSNLKNLVKIYECLNSLRFVTDEFKNLVNTY